MVTQRYVLNALRSLHFDSFVIGIWAALRTWIDASEELHGLARSAVGALLWLVFIAVMLAPFVAVYLLGRASG